MATGREEFERQLRQLGYSPDTSTPDNKVSFSYVVPGGRFNGQIITLGLEIPVEFPRTPPSGPHIKPRLLPLNTSAQHPDRAAESPFGPDWEYLSRPYQNPKWKGNEGVAEYLVFIDHIFRTT